MSFLHLVFCSLTINNLSEGRTVSGIIGQNVSFSWTFNIIKNDVISILHNGSPILRLFPNNNPPVPHESSHRVSLSLSYTTEKITVTINVLNLTENDEGTYRVVRTWNLEDLDDSVSLQTAGRNFIPSEENFRKDSSVCLFSRISHYTSIETIQEETEVSIYYTTTLMSKKEDKEGINPYTTTALSQKDNKEDFPSKSHLMYIVLGMGGILAIASFTCILYKIRICIRVDRGSIINTFTDSNKDDGGENLPGNYWTIVSNERGELSTAIETDFDRHSGPILTEQTITVATTNKESEEILGPDNLKINEECDGYLNPIHSSSMESDEYIHPVHSDPLNTDFVSTLQ